LTDPKVGITRCIAYALEALGAPVPGMEELTSWIGPPILDSFRTQLGDMDPELPERAVEKYRERFSEIGIFENEVYEGIPEALAELVAGGARLVLATSKPKVYAERILDHFDLTRYFAAVHGSGLDGSLSDKGELIGHILGVEGCSAVMVGDRKHDIIGAAACGVPCIGVLYGYGSREELVAAGAACLCERPLDLPAVVLQVA
jgi:phosphoglycolate phosphatase